MLFNNLLICNLYNIYYLINHEKGQHIMEIGMESVKHTVEGIT